MPARVLSLEEAQQVLAEARLRGEYLAALTRFVDSGDLAWDFSDEFPGKEPEAIRNSVNQNAEKHSRANNWPAFKIVIDKDTKHCVVINMKVLAEMQNGATPAES